MYELLGVCLVLTALLVINSLASMFFAAIWRLSERRLTHLSAHARAEILFLMRTLPPTLALICVGVLMIPAYVAYEPHVTSEIVSTRLGILALVSAGGAVFALWRAYRSWYATRSLLREWMRVSERIDLRDLTIPTFRIQHSFPIIAVVGSVKPRLFVASSVLAALTKDELSAAIAHERGHLVARDNLKRLVLRACRDILMLLPFGRVLDRAWAQAAEAAADEHAARENPDRALSLASALVKIAKMVPAKARAEVPLGAYLIGAEETHGVKARIRRLLDIAADGIGKRDNRLLIRAIQTLSLVGFGICAVVAACNPRVLMGVHELIEHTVALLC